MVLVCNGYTFYCYRWMDANPLDLVQTGRSLMIKFNKSHHLIHWWKGTDTLKLVMFPPTSHISWYIRIVLERIIWKCTEWMIREHWIDHEFLKANLIKFGINESKIKIVADPIWADVTVTKKPHDLFTVAYYRAYNKKNQVFKDWLYGYDLVRTLKQRLPAFIEFIEIQPGMPKQQVLDLLALSDVYIRPNRHDGNSRLAAFCKAVGVPVYHTRENPKYGNLVDFIMEEHHRCRSN